MLSVRRFAPHALCLVGLVLALVACTGDITGELERAAPGQAARFVRVAHPIAGQYIVALASPTGVRTIAAPDLGAALATRYPLTVTRTLGAALPAIVVRDLSEADALALSEDEDVAFVEEDGVVAVSTTQDNATFGLDRIDQLDLPLDGRYRFGNDGSGVDVFVIDTGIHASHVDLGGRVRGDFDAVGDGNGTEDCVGHGTHVAGTIGSKTFGVAKGVTLHAVRVLGCNGTGASSDVIAGIDFVAQHATGPAVANMSLGGGASLAIDRAVQAAVAKGVTFVVAAGNESADACGGSPARVPEAITVGASDRGDRRASFSNFGSCVDLFAPGDNITSLSPASDTATAVLSGTSMASPHVAGAAAMFLAANPGASPAEVVTALTDGAAAGKIVDARGAPNRLLNVSFIAGGGGTPPPPPPPPPPPTGGTARTGSATGQVAQGQDVRFVPLAVVAGTSVDVTLSGTGDPDLYVQFGAAPALVTQPTQTDHLCAPFVDGPGERCTMTVPADASQVFIMVHGFAAASFRIDASWTEP